MQENDSTKVSITLGYTLNLGNFQSLRLDLGVVDSKKDGETTSEAFERVYGFVESKLTEKIQDRMALLGTYAKHHKVKYGQQPSINKWTEQWSADALIESYGLGTCYDLLEYYFKVAQSPSWNFFSYNAEKIWNAKIDKEKDNFERLERRRKAKEWLSE